MATSVLSGGFNVAFFGSAESMMEIARRVAAQERGLTDEQVIANLLRFANSAGPELSHFIGGAVLAAAEVDDAARSEAVGGERQTHLADNVRKDAPSIHAWVQRELGKIARRLGCFQRLHEGRPGITSESPVQGPVVFERIINPGPSSETERRLAFSSLDDFAEWAMELARGPSFSRRICQCHLESCRRFFLIPKRSSGGRPRDKFCAEPCMKEAHENTTLERVEASRAGIAVGKWREMTEAQRAAAKQRSKAKRKHK